MAKDLLLEIGLEEVPARFVRDAMDQLKHKFEKWLQEHRISYETIQAFATPRRLAILATAVAEKQTDVEEEARPSRKIAQDDNGNWSKAALGFARSQGVEPESLYFKELSGVEYVYAKKAVLAWRLKQCYLKALQMLLLQCHSLKICAGAATKCDLYARFAG